MMKSQDIFLLLKLIILEEDSFLGDQSARGLAALTGIGKTEVNASVNRSIDVGLAKVRNARGMVSVNKKRLFEFVYYGLKFVFPVKPAELTRGVPTSFAAPVLSKKLFSAGDTKLVWPEAEAETMGQAVTPLYRTVTFAIKGDAKLYSYLALIDAIRIGNARELRVASKELQKLFEI